MTATPRPFRFDARTHEYVDLETGAVLPHITGMLQAAGLVDDTWFTAESCARGQAVHALTAEFDFGTLDPTTRVIAESCRGYVRGYVAATGILQPEILAIEEPAVHSTYRFGGRPDRVVLVRGRRGVLEIKTGAPAKSHAMQTALQAILLEPEAGLPAEMLARWCLYLRPTGRFILEEHTRRQDVTEAHRIVRAICR